MTSHLCIISVVVDWPFLCEAACAASADCSFWTYQFVGKICKLKSSDSGKVDAAGYTSGPKTCAGKAQETGFFNIQFTQPEFKTQ